MILACGEQTIESVDRIARPVPMQKTLFRCGGHERLDGDLAYTTVMTIMNRLWNKGLLDRAKEGRAFRYRPLRTESEVIAARMSDALGFARDREASLSRFVEDLEPGDEAVLRALLERST